MEWPTICPSGYKQPLLLMAVCEDSGQCLLQASMKHSYTTGNRTDTFTVHRKHRRILQYLPRLPSLEDPRALCNSHLITGELRPAEPPLDQYETKKKDL